MRKRTAALLAALLLAAGSLSASAVIPFSTWTIGVATGWERTASSEAVPVVGNSVFAAGIDITRSSATFAYVEAGFDAPAVRLSTFTSRPSAYYGGIGLGWCDFYDNGFSLAIRAGLVDRHYGNEAGLKIDEPGISAAIVLRKAVYALDSHPIGYGFEMPVTAVYSGSAISVTVGFNVFFDVSSSYQRGL